MGDRAGARGRRRRHLARDGQRDGHRPAPLRALGARTLGSPLDFSLSDDQILLAATVDDLGARLLGPEVARRAMAGDRSGADAAWQACIDVGLVDLLVPADAGGQGGSLIDACIVAEHLAAALSPLPYVGTAIVTATAAARSTGSGAALILAGITAGRPHALALGEDLELPTGPGSSVLFEWVPGAVACALAPGGTVEVMPGEPTVGESVDLLRPLGRLALAGGGGIDDAVTVALRATARVGVAATSVGAAAGALAMAVAHAGTRHQFGRPIGSFQAVQQLCADMLTDVESARSALYAAAWEVSRDPWRGAWTAAIARLWCGRVGIRVCEAAIQVLGGMGITWECDAHLHLRTAWLAGTAFGTDDGLLDEIAAGTVDRLATAGVGG